MKYRVYRTSDGLWLAQVSRHSAVWMRDESQALTFTEHELLMLGADVVRGCEFPAVPSPVFFDSWTYG